MGSAQHATSFSDRILTLGHFVVMDEFVRDREQEEDDSLVCLYHLPPRTEDDNLVCLYHLPPQTEDDSLVCLYHLPPQADDDSLVCLYHLLPQTEGDNLVFLYHLPPQTEDEQTSNIGYNMSREALGRHWEYVVTWDSQPYGPSGVDDFNNFDY
ncbi:hypothetical protein Btru_064531 [Bulinus truncatus]|nr:hypothetical protein Btru_064531 [Bulinus truncatus]